MTPSDHFRSMFLPAAVLTGAIAITWGVFAWPTHAVHIRVPGRAGEERSSGNGVFQHMELERLWWELAAEPFTAGQAMNKLVTSPRDALALRKIG
jgi:hypothetical protein